MKAEPGRPPTLSRETVLERLAALETELRSQNVRSLSLFGSVARGEAMSGSDIDIAICAEKPFGLLDLSGVIQFLEERLDHRVNVVVDGEDPEENPLTRLSPNLHAALSRDGVIVF